MSTGKRVGVAIVAGLVVVLLVTVIRTTAGADPVVSHGLGGPGFLGAIAAFVVWSITGRSDRPDV